MSRSEYIFFLFIFSQMTVLEWYVTYVRKHVADMDITTIQFLLHHSILLWDVRAENSFH